VTRKIQLVPIRWRDKGDESATNTAVIQEEKSNMAEASEVGVMAGSQANNDFMDKGGLK